MKELHTKYKKPHKILILNVTIQFIVQISLLSTEKVIFEKLENLRLSNLNICVNMWKFFSRSHKK